MKKRLAALIISLVCCLSAYAAKQPLAAEQAFQLKMHQEGNQLVATFTMAPGYYLYKDDFKFKFTPVDIHEGAIAYPAPMTKTDELGEKHEIYLNKVELHVPLISKAAQEGSVSVSFQGCAEEGFCYPPMHQEMKIKVAASGAEALNKPATSTGKGKTFFQTENVFVLLLGFFGFGLLLSFTPCVLPMIPILSSIILGQGKIGPLRSFYLSGTYVLGMSVAYAIAGLLASLAGGHLQTYMQSPIILSIFSVMFVLLALSLFGLYDLKMPNFFHHHVTRISNKQKSGTFIGVFIMGFLSILIISPCVSAPLVAALGLISEKGNLILGTWALWLMGVGMGVPLLLIGTFGPRFLPKTGKWMNVVKAAFGVVMLGLAIMLLSRFLPGFVILLCWATLLIITSVSMGALAGIPNTYASRVWHGIAYVFFVYGVILLVGAAQGHRDPLMPLKSEVISRSESCALNFQVVKSSEELAAALEKAKGQLVMVDFSATWCISCHQLEQFTFSNPEVQSKLKTMKLIKVDVSTPDANVNMLEAKYGVVAPPTLLFFDTKGNWLKDKTIVGEVGPAEFLSQLVTL